MAFLPSHFLDKLIPVDIVLDTQLCQDAGWIEVTTQIQQLPIIPLAHVANTHIFLPPTIFEKM